MSTSCCWRFKPTNLVTRLFILDILNFLYGSLSPGFLVYDLLFLGLFCALLFCFPLGLESSESEWCSLSSSLLVKVQKSDQTGD